MDDEKIRQELDNLSPETKRFLEERDENLLRSTMRGAAVAVMARNFSHGLGRLWRPTQ